MKHLILFLLAVAGFGIANAQKVGEKVQIEYYGTWYDGQILKTNNEGEFYVKYKDWDDSWNEWVTVDRLRGFASKATPATTKYQVGDKVEVEYGMVPEAATVIEVGETKYKVKFEKKVFGTKWVTEKQMKKL
jgi:hypothetical protein